jgi:flavin-binding protein dodecin
MSVAKVIEISAESPDSFEDAIRKGIAKASKTVTHMQGAWVQEESVVIEDNRVTAFRVNLKITFILD